ncbi:winged helix-turn-helix transcriptional regulator [Phreatobacter cathodiphilus]|uniref:Transcriptional regulator n=1 Tax=Phreatobacter cathodiphilus TaxID=1868589 RepID=A0A2S0N629_9HYPH|nr:helix-turn-helix domain-containing protein [Phreatobacter cathodiphilus]AVO43604.1 transcriptional regulator [Phreatobacter cathodiphilus]
MVAHGQFCAVARTQDLLGGRWTLLVVRELLCGARRFNDVRRGIPRISRTVLSERLQALVEAGVARRLEGHSGPEYELTAAGRDLVGIIAALGTWGQRWLPRPADREVIDLDPLLLDMQRRVRPAAAPAEPFVVRIALKDLPVRFLLMKDGDVAACGHNPGFPEMLEVSGPLGALAGWWRGDLSFAEARRRGLALSGPRSMTGAFPRWFDRYLFADVAPAAS